MGRTKSWKKILAILALAGAVWGQAFTASSRTARRSRAAEAWIYDNVLSVNVLATVPGNSWLNLQYERALSLRQSFTGRLGLVSGATSIGGSYRFWFSRGPSLTQWFVGPAADIAFYNGGNSFRGGVEGGYQLIWSNQLALTPLAGVYFNPGGLQLGIGLAFGFAWGG